MTDNTPRWMKDAGEFGAGSGFPERGIGMRPADIEARVAALLRGVEAIASSSEVLHRVAVHEGAHAIVARALGMPLVEVAIGDAGAGHTRSDVDRAPGWWTPTETAAVIMAGALAERRWCPSTDLAGSDDDENDLLRLMELEDPPDIRYARELAAGILDDNRDDHGLVVDALIRRRRLSGEDVTALLGPAYGVTPHTAVRASEAREQGKDVPPRVSEETRGGAAAALATRDAAPVWFGYSNPNHTRDEFIRRCAQSLRAGRHLAGRIVFGGPGDWHDVTDAVLAEARGL